MGDQDGISQCWYKIIDDKFKVDNVQVEKYGIDKCVDCKFLITSLSYQQNSCGSRYCQDCYDKLNSKYNCSMCKEEGVNNYVHMRNDIFADKARKRDMEKMKITCPDCNTELKISDLESHVRQDCEKGWEVCKKCQMMYKKNVKHDCQRSLSGYNPIYKLCSRCGKECSGGVHNCKMDWNQGCPYGCKLENTSIKDHREIASLYHLDMCYAILKELKLTDNRQNEESAQSDVCLQYVVEKIKSDLDCRPTTIETLTKELSSLRQEITEEKHINEIIRENQLNSLSELQNTSFDGTIMWRIDNFSKVKKDAADNIQKSIFSPPFYSSRFGYKMCLRLYPNGDTTANGIAMSLFLVIMKGNYDAKLHWPFKQKVTFILVDPEFKTNWIDAFIPSDNMSSFSRPRTDMNIPSGSSHFIKFDDMGSPENKYAKDDTVFIRCIVDCSDIF